MTLGAALYIRLSKEDASSESITNQREMLTDYCVNNAIAIYDVYIDDGFSGGNFDRPAFKRMINDIEDKHVNSVITKDMSRLGRDYILTGHYMERYFPEKGVRYISLLDGIDTGLELVANDITPFRAVINDLYAKDISKKIKSVKRAKQEKGLFIGWKPPYGYKTAPENLNVLVIDATAAVNVKKMFELALKGEGCRQISEYLNDKNIPSPAVYAKLRTCGKWSAERVSEMLKNRVYAGDMVQRRMEKVSYKSSKCRRLTEDKWVVVENTHEPIINKDDFENVGNILNSRKRTRQVKHDYLLKGIIHCKECHVPMGVIRRKLKDDSHVFYLICRTYQRATKNRLCTSHCIRESKVADIIIGRINNHGLNCYNKIGRTQICKLISKIELSADKKLTIKYNFAPEEVVQL